MSDSSSPALEQNDHLLDHATQTARVDVRELRSHDEFVACVDLQHEIWGVRFSDHVPASLLKVCPRIGGVTAGAFDESGRLLGFVFGMTGVERGQLVHWSDMLAVRANARDAGIGRRLKEFQRDRLLRLGVTTIYWTFDPLVARNAHFNFNRLGVRVVEYALDLYGHTDSPLHDGLGTDRLIVAWPIALREAPGVHDPRASAQSLDVLASRILNPSNGDGVPSMPETTSPPIDATVRVEIPLRVERVQATSLPTAALWRATTRRAFLWSFDHGYTVRGFYRDDATDRGYYVLTRSAPASTAHPGE